MKEVKNIRDEFIAAVRAAKPAARDYVREVISDGREAGDTGDYKPKDYDAGNQILDLLLDLLRFEGAGTNAY